MITFTYARGSEEQPHLVIINLNGTQTTVGFDSLKPLQEFVGHTQFQLAALMSEAIANIPPPRTIPTVDEEFIESTLDALNDLQSKVDDLEPEFDLRALANAVKSAVESFDTDEMDIGVDRGDVYDAIGEVRGELLAKQEELQEARQAIEEENREKAERRRLREAERAAAVQSLNGRLPTHQ